MKRIIKLILVFSTLAAITAPGTANADIMLSEILYNAAGVDTGKEWIELWNSSTVDPVWLENFDLTSSSKHYILPGIYLAPLSTLLIHWNASGTDSGNELYTGSLKNMGDSSDYAALFDSQGEIIDYLRYYDGESSEVKTWETEAVSKGIWQSGDYIQTVAAGNSIELLAGSSGNSSEEYFEQVSPSPGTFPPVAPEPSAGLLFCLGYLLTRLKIRKMP